MSPFITFTDKSASGETEYYILQREYPHFVGMIAYIPSVEPICQVPIAGHHLYINFWGTLRGRLMPISKNIDKEIGSVFEQMASWYYQNRILTDPKRYKKFAISL